MLDGHDRGSAHPARSPRRQGTIRMSRVARGSERLKIPSRTPARSCAWASAMSPPMTMAAGLKKLTVRREPLKVFVRRRAPCAMRGVPFANQTHHVAAVGCLAAAAARRVASARPPAIASRQLMLPQAADHVFADRRSDVPDVARCAARTSMDVPVGHDPEPIPAPTFTKRRWGYRASGPSARRGP